MTSVVKDWTGIAWYAGATALCFVGYLVPSIDFTLADSALLLGLYLLGSAFVLLVGGQQRRRMLMVYGVYSLIASVAFLLATMWGSLYGSTSPVFMINRFTPRDDFNLYEGYIRPWISAQSVSLFDGQTNAPLHWYVNVRMQQVFLLLTDRPQMMLGNALNIIIGSINASLIVGILGLARRPSASARFPRGLPIAFVLTCPWFLASSIIAIREIWVYAIFSLALYGGLAVSRWMRIVRLGGLAAVSAVCGFVCFFLRTEMMPTVIALVLIAGLTVRDTPLGRRAETLIIAGIVGVTLIAVVPALVLRHGTVIDEMLARNDQYGEASKSLNAGEQGTVQGLVGSSRTASAIVQTLWLPFAPLPRVIVPLGSVFGLCRLLMPVWVIACLAAIFVIPRARRPRGLPPEGSVARRYRWLLLWMLGMQATVGATSMEPRHFFVVLPVACCVLGDVFQVRTQGPYDVVVAWRRGVTLALVFLLLAISVTFFAFGFDAMFPRG